MAIGTATMMLATEPRLSIVWDEGYTLGREARLRLWFKALVDPPAFAARWQPPVMEYVQQVGVSAPSRAHVNSRASLLFDPKVLAWFWPFAREEPHGHPPFYALAGLIGDLLTPWRPALERARLGPILIFSLTAGVLFQFVTRRWGIWAGTLAAGAWVLQPQLFGHGHYATYDAILSAFWLNASLAFALAVRTEPEAKDSAKTEVSTPTDPKQPAWKWVFVFGLLLGLAADTKFTGWLLPLPLVAWTGIYRSRRGALTVLAGCAVAGITLYAINPPWWTEPIAGLGRFFASNLGRGETIPIQTLFQGRVISTPDGSLPWYNTLLWTILATPVGFLLLAIVGTGRSLNRVRSETFGLLVAGQWAFFLVLRALPHTPGHDGVRQFLPAFGLLALVGGLGAASVVERLGSWGRGLVIAALAEGLVSVMLSMPVPLSYFSPIVGGLPGAAALGMEPTYYWDALTGDARDWLLTNTSTGQKVMFASNPTSWLYLRDQHQLPRGILATDPGAWTWYVLQNRPGAFKPVDRYLAKHAQPGYTVTKWGVPLLWIFPFRDVESALRRNDHSNNEKIGAGSRRRKTEPPTTPRARRKAVGRSLSFVWEHENPDSLTGSHRLGRGLAAGGGIVGNGGGGGLARHRGRGAGGLLVAEAAQLQLLVAAATGMLEQAALRSGGRAGLAHRGRGRGRTRLNNRARLRNMAALLLVASRSISRGENAEDASQGQGQKNSTHDVISCCACINTQNTQSGSSREFGLFRCPARILRVN